MAMTAAHESSLKAFGATDQQIAQMKALNIDWAAVFSFVVNNLLPFIISILPKQPTPAPTPVVPPVQS